MEFNEWYQQNPIGHHGPWRDDDYLGYLIDDPVPNCRCSVVTTLSVEAVTDIAAGERVSIDLTLGLAARAVDQH